LARSKAAQAVHPAASAHYLPAQTQRMAASIRCSWWGDGWSTADQEQLNRTQATAGNEQRAVLEPWQAAFSTLPSGPAGDPPISL